MKTAPFQMTPSYFIMRNIVVVLLFTFCLSQTACITDKANQAGTLPDAATIKELLVGNGQKQWAINSRKFEGKKEVINACDKKDRLTFFANNTLTVEDYLLNEDKSCTESILKGTWILSPDNKVLTINFEIEGETAGFELYLQNVTAKELVVKDLQESSELISTFRAIP